MAAPLSRSSSSSSSRSSLPPLTPSSSSSSQRASLLTRARKATSRDLSEDESGGTADEQEAAWAEAAELAGTPWLAYAQRWPAHESVLPPRYLLDDVEISSAAVTPAARALPEPSCERARDRVMLVVAGSAGRAGAPGSDGRAEPHLVQHGAPGADGEPGTSARDVTLHIVAWDASARVLRVRVCVDGAVREEEWPCAQGERLVIDARGGDGGSGGRGGDGVLAADASRYGVGGNGGWGGCGGHGGHVIVSAMDSALFALLSVLVQGGAGGEGGKGGKSVKGAPGAEGEPGARGLDGSVEWRVVDGKGALVECAPALYALRVSEVRLESARQDTVLAPGDALMATFSVENAGALALPPGAVLSVLPSAQLAWQSSPLSVTLPALAPAQRLAKLLSARATLVPAPPVTTPTRLEGIAYVPLRATLLDAPLRSACVVSALAVRCPVILDRVELPDAHMPNTTWTLRVHVHNRSSQPVPGARVRVAVDERVHLSAPLDAVPPGGPWRVCSELAVPTLAPHASTVVELTCALTPLASQRVCARVPVHVELLWAGQCVEVQEPNVRVVPECTWASARVDVVALLGGHTRAEHVDTLNAMCATLGLTLGLWDIDYHGSCARAARAECACACAPRSASASTWSDVSPRACVIVLGDEGDIAESSWLRDAVDWPLLVRHLARARWLAAHTEPSAGAGAAATAVLVYGCAQTLLADVLLSEGVAHASEHAVTVGALDKAPALTVNELRARASEVLAELRTQQPLVAHRVHAIERGLVTRADGSVSAACIRMRASPLNALATMWCSETPWPSAVPTPTAVPLEYAHALVTLLCALPLEVRLTRPPRVRQWPLALDAQSIVAASLVRELQLDALYRVPGVPWPHLAALHATAPALLAPGARDTTACALVRYALHALQTTLDADAHARPLVTALRTLLGTDAREEAALAALLEHAVRAPPPPLPPPNVKTLLTLAALTTQDEKDYVITSAAPGASDLADSRSGSAAAAALRASRAGAGGSGAGSAGKRKASSASDASGGEAETLLLTDLAEQHGASHTMLGVIVFAAREVSAKEARAVLKIGEQKLKTSSRSVPESGAVTWDTELVVLVRGSYSDATLTLSFRDDSKKRSLGELHWHMRTLRTMHGQPPQWVRLGQGTQAEALLQFVLYDRKQPRPPRLDKRVKLMAATEDAVVQSLGLGSTKKDRAAMTASNRYHTTSAGASSHERHVPAPAPLRQSQSDAAVPVLPEIRRTSNKAAQLMGLAPSTSAPAAPTPTTAPAAPSTPPRPDKAQRLMGMGTSASELSGDKGKDKKKEKKEEKEKEKEKEKERKAKEKEKEKEEKERKRKEKEKRLLASGAFDLLY